MKKGQSLARKVKRGNIRMVFNQTLEKMEFFRKTSNGLFLICSSNGADFGPGPGVTASSLNTAQKN